MTAIDPTATAAPARDEPPPAFADPIALTALSNLYQLAGLPEPLARRSARADIACGLAPRPGEFQPPPICAR